MLRRRCLTAVLEVKNRKFCKKYFVRKMLQNHRKKWFGDVLSSFWSIFRCFWSSAGGSLEVGKELWEVVEWWFLMQKSKNFGFFLGVCEMHQNDRKKWFGDVLSSFGDTWNYFWLVTLCALFISTCKTNKIVYVYILLHNGDNRRAPRARLGYE